MSHARFTCPFVQCTQRVHSLSEIHADVTISKTLEACIRVSSLLLKHTLDEQDWSDCSSSDSILSDVVSDKASIEYILSELECQVCCTLLEEPLTTQCGHTFCKDCLFRSADYNNRCPVCRHQLPDCLTLLNGSQNWLLSNLIQGSFPNLVKLKRVTDKSDVIGDTPLFISSLVFPNMPVQLHIFEPEHRLMIRRCLRTKQKRIGMVLPGRHGQPFMPYGTMLGIHSVETLPDGRSLVKAIGLHRFRVLQHSNQDGYYVGKVERVDDTDLEESPSTSLLNQPSLNELMTSAHEFVNFIQGGCAPWLIQKFHITYGCMPSNPSDFSFWASSIIPINEYEKYRLLEAHSIRKRLSMIVHWVKRLKEQRWFDNNGQ
ncbi:hypothetical protein K7432_000337 [Basidiobolus ranarum]|uniref:Uncharacterized protein n=1 Tax=Basidiobolus ranarum TaxID=34480 RepID=A0ABR2WBD2_9FUNG